VIIITFIIIIIKQEETLKKITVFLMEPPSKVHGKATGLVRVGRRTLLTMVCRHVFVLHV